MRPRVTAELIRHQAEPIDAELGVALLLADEAMPDRVTRPSAPSRSASPTRGGRRTRRTSAGDGDDASTGRIALLLSLIEQRQLDVLTVRLGDLCGAYLDAIAAHRGAAGCRCSARS